MTLPIPAPLQLRCTSVAADWVDDNGHLNEWAYLLIFGDNADAFLRLGEIAVAHERLLVPDYVGRSICPPAQYGTAGVPARSGWHPVRPRSGAWVSEDLAGDFDPRPGAEFGQDVRDVGLHGVAR